MKSVKIKELFDEVVRLEGHKFEINEVYKQLTPIKTTNEFGEEVEVIGMVIKEVKTITFKTERNESLSVGENHLFQSNKKNVFASELKVGDKLDSLDGPVEVTEIVESEEKSLVYDLEINSGSHLYSDALGLIHHNTGKSYTLNKQLDARGMTNKEDYVIVKGKATPKALYGELFLNNGKLIVFDDADSVFGNEDSVNILKGALDSSPVRNISWKSSQTYDPSLFELDDEPGVYDLDAMHHKALNEGKYPNEFDFDGRVIFISNIPGHKMDTAIKSRSFNVDVMIKAKDLLNRMGTILNDVEPDLPINEDQRKETLKLLKDTIGDDDSKEVTLRTLVKALKLRSSGSKNWKRLVENYA